MKEKQNRNSTLQKMLVVTQLVEQAGRCHIRRERHTTPAKNRSYGQQGYHGAGGTKAQSDSKKKFCILLVRDTERVQQLRVPYRHSYCLSELRGNGIRG